MTGPTLPPSNGPQQPTRGRVWQPGEPFSAPANDTNAGLGGPTPAPVGQPPAPNPTLRAKDGRSPTGHPGTDPALDPGLYPQANPDAISQQIGDGRSFLPSTGELGQIYTQNRQSVGTQETPSRIFAPGAMPVQLPPSLAQPNGAAFGLDNPLITPPGQASIGASVQGEGQDAAQLLMEQMQQQELENAPKRKKALRAMYGDAFPLSLDRDPTDTDWQRWCDERWQFHRPGVQHNIWMAERNRQFRAGYQYLSRINSMGAWRETPSPRDAVRIVANLIRPALSWALQVVSEQRPGWQFRPTNTDPDRQQKADAQQRAVEYQYEAQKKRLLDREAMYWAQTDGVAFQMTYWDPDKGPWEENPAWIGKKPLGEMCTVVRRIEHVVVSSEATSTIPPMYWIVRDILPMQYAVSLYGPEVADSPDQALLAQQTSQWSTTNQYAYAPLYQNQTTVVRYMVFCDQREWMPGGLTAIVVGRKLVYGPKPLLIGRVPLVRITDGSEDPAFFPIPKCNLLIAPQMRVNMLLSKWYESIRKNSGGRYATKTNAVSSETFIGGETSLLEVRTSGDIRESFMPVQGFSVGNDIKEALDREVTQIEELTGYTKEARGQFENDESGRAILAQRETLERVFAPQSAALAEANTEWAKQAVLWMRFGWQMPRTVAVFGKNRTDLATQFSSPDFDGVVDITVDPSSMVPKPLSLEKWELDNAYDRKIIGPDEWRRRSRFGNLQDFQTPNEVQYARAMRIVEQIKLIQPQEPVLWQDDEAIHQNVLDEQIILAGGVEPQVMQAAQMRWQQLAMQQQRKMQGQMQAAAQLQPPPSKALPGGKGAKQDPKTQPLAGGNPSVAAAPTALQGGPGVSRQEAAAGRFEASTPLQ